MESSHRLSNFQRLVSKDLTPPLYNIRYEHRIYSNKKQLLKINKKLLKYLLEHDIEVIDLIFDETGEIVIHFGLIREIVPVPPHVLEFGLVSFQFQYGVLSSAFESSKFGEHVELFIFCQRYSKGT